MTDEIKTIRARYEADPYDRSQAVADRATLLRLLDAARAELAEERAKIREAAGPFVRDRAEIADGIPDDTSFSMVEFHDLGVAEFTVGDLRRLAAALAKDATT